MRITSFHNSCFKDFAIGLLIFLFISVDVLIAQSSVDYDTDVLQESLYVHITRTLRNQNSISFPALPANKSELLEINKRYYPQAVLNNDTLLIPYPSRKVKELPELKYIIPRDFFNGSSEQVCLQPDISLTFNRSKSTITMNKSYPMTFYRSPKIRIQSLEQIKKALEYIFDMILPCAFSQIDHKNQIKGIIHYKGYIPHDIDLENDEQFSIFLECLRREGSMYYYPSKVDNLEENLMIYGLLYVINDEFRQYYHFGELTIIFNKENFLSQSELKLILYPFIKNIEAM